MNPKVDSRARVENANLRLLCGRLAFARLALPKISDRIGGLPKWVVEGSIETRWMINAHCLGLMINANRLGYLCSLLGNGRARRRRRARVCVRGQR